MTTQEIILEMEKLPPEERQVVLQHFEEEAFKTPDGSPVTTDRILEEADLCKQRVDVVEHDSADDFCKAHGLT